MANEDFDIDRLARYLHISASQVHRMAERGHLPARRIAGQWRFAPGEIHHWLEERIGIGDEGELADMEGALDRHHGVEDAVDLVAMMPVEAIDASLPAKTRGAVILAMADLAANAGLLWDPAKMANAVRARENLHPTALESGVALLHPRRPLSGVVSEPFLALGRTPSALPFGGPRGTLTDLFFLLGSRTDAGHLRLLARLSRFLSTPGTIGALREAPDAVSMREVLATWEDAFKN